MWSPSPAAPYPVGMKLLPHFIVAGALVVGVIGTVVTGVWLILLVVALIAVAYVALVRRTTPEHPTQDDRLATELPSKR